MKHKKFKLLIALSIVLTMLLSVGVTYAYFSAGVGSATNVITPSKDIKAVLSEPNWNKDDGLRLTPGVKTPKDPMMTNTSDIPIYAAIKVVFEKKDQSAKLTQADYDKLLTLITIDWNESTNANAWSCIQGKDGAEMIFVYNSSLDVGKITDPLFSNVAVHAKGTGLTEEKLLWLQGLKIVNGEVVADATALGGFNIALTGAAIQKEGFASVSDTYAQFKSLLT